MGALSACSPYEISQTPIGAVPRPMVSFSVLGPSQTLNLVGMFDSRSDITMLPLYVGQALGFNPQPQISTFGVSGSASGQIFRTQISVAGKTFTAPVFVTVNDDAPILLGRAQVWSEFDSFTFYNSQSQFCFGSALPEPISFQQPTWMLVAAAAVGAVVAWLFLR